MNAVLKFHMRSDKVSAVGGWMKKFRLLCRHSDFDFRKWQNWLYKWPWKMINRTLKALSTIKPFEFNVSWESSLISKNMYIFHEPRADCNERVDGIHRKLLLAHIFPEGVWFSWGHLSSMQVSWFPQMLVTVNRCIEVGWLQVFGPVIMCLERHHY